MVECQYVHEDLCHQGQYFSMLKYHVSRKAYYYYHQYIDVSYTRYIFRSDQTYMNINTITYFPYIIHIHTQFLTKSIYFFFFFIWQTETPSHASIQRKILVTIIVKLINNIIIIIITAEIIYININILVNNQNQERIAMKKIENIKIENR